MNTTHNDTIAAQLFVSKMISRLDEKRGQGFGGWDDTARCTPEYLMDCLYRSLGKGKLVDAANFAMMIEARGMTHKEISELALRTLLRVPKEGA